MRRVDITISDTITISNKELAFFFFKRIKKYTKYDIYKCICCNVTRKRQHTQCGYTHMVSHVTDKHKDWKRILAEAFEQTSDLEGDAIFTAEGDDFIDQSSEFEEDSMQHSEPASSRQSVAEELYSPQQPSDSHQLDYDFSERAIHQQPARSSQQFATPRRSERLSPKKSEQQSPPTSRRSGSPPEQDSIESREILQIAEHIPSALSDDMNEHQKQQQPISAEIARKYLSQLAAVVEQRIGKEMPDKFGLIMDTWRNVDGASYIAVFACYLSGTGQRCYPLLSFQPIFAVDDLEFRLNLLTVCLESYGRKLKNILFLVGNDECPVDINLANHLYVPIIGCACRRLQLAFEYLMDPHTDAVNRMFQLIRRISNLPRYRKIINDFQLFIPTSGNSKRITSVRSAVGSYREIRPFIETDTELLDYALKSEEEQSLRNLQRPMECIYESLIALQQPGVTLSDARCLFDKLIEDFSNCQLEYWLGKRGSVTLSESFENGLVKILNNQVDLMCPAERDACKPFFIKHPKAALTMSMDNYADRILAAKRSRICGQQDEYADVAFIPPSAAMVERLFEDDWSQLCYRQEGQVSSVEAESTLYLKQNSRFWSRQLAHEIYQRSNH